MKAHWSMKHFPNSPGETQGWRLMVTVFLVAAGLELLTTESKS
jgi:hypothetical protein